VHCFAGCALSEILAPLGLALRDLFPESSVTPAQMRTASAIRRAREEQELQQREINRTVRKRVATLNAIVDEVISRLVVLPDDCPESYDLAKLFHQTLDELRLAEVEVQIERP
jgi:hypothetical protein